MPLNHLWQTIKAHLAPKVLEEAYSVCNGKIQVVEVMGNRRIMVGGYVQSGGFVEILWQKSLEKIKHEKKGFEPTNAAIFGFAGGSAARSLNRIWPQITITAVDIDPVIIELGKKYFSTDQIPKLTIHVQSVFDWINQQRDSYDLIIIDLFQGGKIPAQAATDKFMKHLHAILSENGVILINYFPHESNDHDFRAFDNLVSRYFPCSQTFNLLAEKIYLLKK